MVWIILERFRQGFRHVFGMGMMCMDTTRMAMVCMGIMRMGMLSVDYQYIVVWGRARGYGVCVDVLRLCMCACTPTKIK